MKNILVLALSTFNMNKDNNELRSSKLKLNGQEITYYYQMEPVPIMLKEQGKIDEIFVLATSSTLEKKEFLFNGEIVQKSPFEFFQERIQIDNIDITEIDENNITKGIIEVINKIRKENEFHDVNWYLDNHGAYRDVQYVLQAILSLLYKEKIDPVIYTVRYDPNARVSEIINSGISINDFISGINEFLDTGHMDSLERYFSKMEKQNSWDSQITDLVRDISDAILLCDIEHFYAALDHLSDWIQKRPEDSNSYLDLFINYIEDDYGDLLDQSKRTHVKAIDWCLRKKFIQQALTIIESWMPLAIFGSKYFKVDLNRRIPEQHQGVNKNWERTGNTRKTIDVINERKLDFESLEGFMIRTWGQNEYSELVEDKQSNLFYDLDLHVDDYDHTLHSISTKWNDRINILIKPNRYTIFINKDRISNHDIQTFKFFIKLHMELKQERNRTNHSSSHNRYKMVSIMKAIKMYVKYANDLGIK